MLIGNYSVLQKSPGRFVAGSTTSVEGQVRSNFSKSGAYRNRFYVDQTTVALSLYAIPTGSYPEITWVLPQISGQIASTQPIQGSGSATASLAGGLNAVASLTGAGDITSATAQLIISMIAAIAGSGTISSADLQGFLDGDSGDLVGAGSLTAAISALAGMSVALSGSGTLTLTPYATGKLEANITGESALSPQNLAAAVWSALAASYNVTDTMGNKLNLAASGGVDYHALGLAVWNILQSEVGDPGTMGEAVETILTNTGTASNALTLPQFIALQNP